MKEKKSTQEDRSKDQEKTSVEIGFKTLLLGALLLVSSIVAHLSHLKGINQNAESVITFLDISEKLLNLNTETVKDTLNQNTETVKDTRAGFEKNLNKIVKNAENIETAFEQLLSVLETFKKRDDGNQKIDEIVKKLRSLSNLNKKFGFAYINLSEDDQIDYGSNVGVIVSGVAPHSPMFFAGIMKGDLIIKLNGIKIIDKRHMEVIVDSIYRKDDKKCTLTIVREKAVSEIKIINVKLRYNTGHLIRPR